MLFIDIGSHDGRYEQQIHERLCREGKGPVFYDDIHWPGMKSFWAKVRQPRIELDWHRESGFGVILYGE
jgi:hypothetical protein